MVKSPLTDKNRHQLILRKECKYHFSNLLVATSYHAKNIRSLADFATLTAEEQGMWYEWLISQELLRRNAIQGDGLLTPLAFWQDRHHEIDFVLSKKDLLEVKRGRSSALEFSWFAKQFPQQILTVINTHNFTTEQINGMTLEKFLLADEDLAQVTGTIRHTNDNTQ